MKRRIGFLLLFTFVFAGVSGMAQDRVAAALSSLPTIKRIDQVAISPDGTEVAYIVDGEISVATAAGEAQHKIGADQNGVRGISHGPRTAGRLRGWRICRAMCRLHNYGAHPPTAAT